MTRLSEGGYGRPVDLEALLTKRRNRRSEPQITTPVRALAKKSLDKAIQRARAADAKRAKAHA